ncbi:signal peptide-containing protein, putative [Babesia ovata]|uniref:Signal peptide-containing protein, putative n=1 Tax=Babesia ovata TaxID=189622 RepID=A0A2H6K749_9APIC|nr:signal peptide-containing protein, putative [Babesia ovata]GBE58826.1 signal peptide-containing protein, putative [Babesia ovata]
MYSSLVALVFAAFLASAAADRWQPVTVLEYLNAERGGHVGRKETQEQLSKVAKLDLNSLARMFYLWRTQQPKVCQRPVLVDDWFIEKKWTTLQERFNFYGLAYAIKEVPGDGSCLFHTIATALRESGVTAKMLMGFLKPRPSKHIIKMMEAGEVEDGFYTMEAIKKISLAELLGIYADDPLSIRHFNAKDFASKIERYASLQVDCKALNEKEIMALFDNVDLTVVSERLGDGADPLTVAKEVYKKVRPQHDNVVGSWIDIQTLEELFQFRLVKLEEHEARVSLSRGLDYPINFVMLTHYTVGIGAKRNIHCAGWMPLQAGRIGRCVRQLRQEPAAPVVDHYVRGRAPATRDNDERRVVCENLGCRCDGNAQTGKHRQAAVRRTNIVYSLVAMMRLGFVLLCAVAAQLRLAAGDLSLRVTQPRRVAQNVSGFGQLVQLPERRAAGKKATGSLRSNAPINAHERAGNWPQYAVHPCDRYASWNRTTSVWDEFLRHNRMALCRKNYGADGNCLYNAIAGILRDHELTIQRVGITVKTLPAGISISLEDLDFSGEYFTVADLRRICAISFIGVDPNNPNALPFWERDVFITKLEILSQVEGSADYGDMRWGPSKFYAEILAGGDRVDIARRVYNMLSQVRNPYTWGSYEDIDALAHVLNLDIMLFWNTDTKIQLFRGHRQPKEKRTALLLYYTEMIHFDGAGLVSDIAVSPPVPIRSMYSASAFPDFLRALAT